MLKKEIKGLFDAVSPDASFVERTEREIENMLNPRIKQNMRRTACVAIAACLLLVGAAFAAVNSGILERLFPNDEPNAQVSEALLHNVASQENNGICVTIAEALLDANTLHMGWTVTSGRENPVYYTTAYEFIYATPEDEALAEASTGGIYGAYSSAEIGDGALVRLAKDESFSGHAGFAYATAPGNPVQARLVIRAYETAFTETPVESVLDLQYAPEGDEQSAMLEAKRQIGIANGMTSINGYASYAEALQKTGDMDAALVESGTFQQVAQLEIDLSIEPEAAAPSRFELDKEQAFTLPDRTITLQRLSLGAASTIVEYRVETHADMNTALCVLLDQNGKPLNADYALSASIHEIESGVYQVSMGGNPLPETITALRFVPMADLPRSEGEPSNAYFLRMAEGAEGFTIELN